MDGLNEMNRTGTVRQRPWAFLSWAQEHCVPSLGSTVSKHLTQVQDAELGVAGRMRYREVRLEGRPGEEVGEDQRWLSIYLSQLSLEVAMVL